MTEKNTERLWGLLLDLIEDRRVIPVIGPELLIFTLDGKSILLYSYLAKQLASRLQIASEPEDTLNTVACRYLSQGGQHEDIYPEIRHIMPPLSTQQLPETLVKLAEINQLNLFITTSFDPLLVHVLNHVRYGDQDKTLVLAFSQVSGSTIDLPVAQEKLDRTTVFHLFGKLTAVPEYAVTDEDILEFMHVLQSKTSRPEKLFDALIKQNLMVVGCPFSDWLARFFVRIAKEDRLIISGGKTDFLVGDQLQNENDLSKFLQHFSNRTKLFPMASIDFVNELHQRWLALRPKNTINTPPIDPDKMLKGAVFLSYAHEDQPAVALIRDALEQAGIDVWFDKDPEALQAGDNYETKIKTNIDQCSIFIPIISRATLTPRPRFFRIEWNHAQDVTVRLPDDLRFIIPVAIDDTSPDVTEVPEKFRKLHWERLENGKTTEAFVNLIKTLYRNYQRTLTQPV